MRRIHFHIGTGYAGADYDEIFEFEDDVTDKEIDEAFREWESNCINAEWYDA